MNRVPLRERIEHLVAVQPGHLGRAWAQDAHKALTEVLELWKATEYPWQKVEKPR